jgi:hypothetical protein
LRAGAEHKKIRSGGPQAKLRWETTTGVRTNLGAKNKSRMTLPMKNKASFANRAKREQNGEPMRSKSTRRVDTDSGHETASNSKTS